MTIEIKLPQFGMGMSEAQVVEWYKKVGDTVKKGEPVVSVEAAKAVNDVEAPVGGVLASMCVSPGDMVHVYDLMGTIATDDTQPEAPVHSAPPARVVEWVATPRARRLAQDNSVDLASISGSGTGGRITDEDVQRVLDQRKNSNLDNGAVGTAPRPLTGIRSEIARRMHESLRDSAQFTLTRTIDVTALVAFRQSSASNVRVSYNDLIVKATALALQLHPALNATCDGKVIQFHSRIDIGVAIALEEGLIVPVVRNADQKSLAAISDEIKHLSERARGAALSASEYRNSTFSVTNLGALEIDVFTPIINPPEVAILGVGRITEHYVRLNGQGEWRSDMIVSLTIDHRVVDGAPAAAFLRTLAGFCASPEKLGASH